MPSYIAQTESRLAPSSLNGIFRHIRFVRITGPGSGIKRLKLPWLLRAWLFFSPEVRYPYWEGYFEGDEFAVVFDLGPDSLIRSVRMTLYGRGTLAAKPLLDALTDQTGWQVKLGRGR